MEGETCITFSWRLGIIYLQWQGTQGGDWRREVFNSSKTHNYLITLGWVSWLIKRVRVRGRMKESSSFVSCNEILNTPWCTSLVTRYYYYFGLRGWTEIPSSSMEERIMVYSTNGRFQNTPTDLWMVGVFFISVIGSGKKHNIICLFQLMRKGELFY